MIGIIPIGGQAKRMHGLPKFLLPVGDTYLLARVYQQMRDAGADRIAIGVHPSNMELAKRYSPGEAIFYEANTVTMSQTVLLAQKYASKQQVLFAMPDTYWTGWDMFLPLIKAYRTSNNPVAAIGLWETPPELRYKRGMVYYNEQGHISDIVDKPDVDLTDATRIMQYGWGSLVWGEQFWHYINPYDLHVGVALKRAFDEKENLVGYLYWKAQYFDCGTPEEYYACIRANTEEPEWTT